MGFLETIALIVSSLGTTTLAANALYLGTYALVIGGFVAGSLLTVQKPQVPKQQDGNYNLKQSVPSLAYVLGRVKKGSDYAFLEEKSGRAYHILVWAAHRINGFVKHYLHDEAITLDVDNSVLTPAHFRSDHPYVWINHRLGLNASTAYSQVVSAFPTIWNNNCRGDGLATILMEAQTAGQKSFMKVFPNNMPEHSAVGEGALLYDPRKDSTQGGSGSHRFTDPNTWEFSTNLALMRLWHLCHPVGGKMRYTAMYLPDWRHAADVCDQNVTNRSGGTEKRYHGGFWFRANNDPTEVGRIVDEAAELVVYERSDGLIGVHAGEYVAPDIRITVANAYSIRVDKNKRRANTVLAVRGRWVNPDNDYNTEDAAIFGDPYGVVDDSTERTKTFDNQAIQSHNHCQRKQKLTFIRANARKVSIVVDYTADNLRQIPSRRFVRVHYPSRGLVEAVVEITSSVTIDLRNMRLSFSGIVVTPSLYAFNAATEEGLPGEVALPAPGSGVPVPVDFSPVVQTEVVSGGATAAFILAAWGFVSSDLTYELEYERTSGSTGVQSAFSEEGQSQVRTGYLVDGQEYRIRLRAWGGGTPSEWTDYEYLTVTADPVAPIALTSFTQTAPAPHLGNAVFSIVTSNDSHLRTVKLYRKATGVPLNIAVDTPIVSLAATASATYSYTNGDATRTNLVTNGDFASSAGWTLPANVTISGGTANKAAAATTQDLLRGIATVASGKTVRGKMDITSWSSGTVRAMFRDLASGLSNSSATFNAVGEHLFSVTLSASRDVAIARFDTASVGSIDNFFAYEETAGCAPQGAWDYYAVPFNGSNVAGPPSGAVAVTII